MKKLVLLLISLILLSNAGAEELTLKEAIKIAQQESNAALVAKSSYESKELAYKGFTADFYPQIHLSGAAPGLVRAINEIPQPDGSSAYRYQNQLSSSTELFVRQKIPLTGGSLFLSSGLSRIDILREEGNDTQLWRAQPVQLRFSQPLFQINNMQWNKRIEDLMYKKSQSEYTEAMEQIAIDVTNKFFELYLSQMSIENAELNVQINDTLYKISQGRYQVGKIAENDLLQNELALLNVENELENQRLNYERQLEEFQILIGKQFKDSIIIKPPNDIIDVKVDPQKAMQEALDNRSTLTNYKIQKVRAERQISEAESDMGFSANLNATFGVNQNASQFDVAYKELIEQETANISFSVPLFRWDKGRMDLQSAKLNKKSVESNIEMNREYFKTEVKYEVIQFNQLIRQVPLSAKADTIAKKRFQVAKNRYMIGKIDLNTFYIAQNEKNSALVSYIRTLKNFWVSYYSLRKLTLYDFRNDTKISYGIE